MRKKQISIALLVIMACAIALPIMGRAQASPQTIIEIYPEETLGLVIGGTFTVDIMITDVIDLHGLQFVLRYDPNILQAVDVVSGTFLEPTEIGWRLDEELTGVPTMYDGYDCDVVQDEVLDIYDLALLMCYYHKPAPPAPLRADIDNDGSIDFDDLYILLLAINNTFVDTPGTIQFTWTYWDVLFDFSGSGTLATVTFEVIGLGETMLDLDNSKLTRLCATPIPHEARDGIASVTFAIPADAIQDLITTIESWDLTGGTENSLTSKLEAALNLLDMDNVNGAVHKFRDFIEQVKAMRGKRLKKDQADYLIARAEVIINAIG